MCIHILIYVYICIHTNIKGKAHAVVRYGKQRLEALTKERTRLEFEELELTQVSFPQFLSHHICPFRFLCFLRWWCVYISICIYVYAYMYSERKEDTCRSHVTHMSEWCYTNMRFSLLIRMSHITYIDKSCHAYVWVMSHRYTIWTWCGTSHATRMNESCHVYV